jgi:eukaryotic-like serine/threonine-protein kinase
MTDPTTRLSTALSDRYVIERELGQGGMATVYLAHDVRHDRKVALKVLRPELAAVIGAARFLQEIRTTANLQHPHILPLHDSGEADGTVYYVMPFVEGESLRGRLSHERQLPVNEAIEIAREVADALEYAHGHGVIHRDIKPENILLHGGHALVADFGIALAVSKSDGGTRMTETGMSLGTPHYMSPEQAMGEREITAKSDVYALGCVLYEMLCGEPPFAGPTAQAIIARVLTEEPRSLTLQRRTVPPHVEAAVQKALAKLPADRFATATQFSDALANPQFVGTVASVGTASRSAVPPFRRSVVVPALTALTAVTAALAAWGWLRPHAAPAGRVARHYVLASDTVGIRPAIEALNMAIAPDGSRFAFVSDVGQGLLWVRRIEELRAQPLLGTDGARWPTFSPDGQWLAFVRGTHLEKIRVDGGATVTLADSANGSYYGGVAWLDDNTIVFADLVFALRRVSAAGGTVSPVVTPTVGGGVGSVTPLPGARGVIYQDCNVNCVASELRVLDLRSGQSHQIAPSGFRGWYLPTGQLLFVRADGAALAAPFDLGTLTLTGSPVPVLDNVAIPTFFPELVVANDGTVLYRSGAARSALNQTFVRVDRSGHATPIDTSWAGEFNALSLSRDGRSMAVEVADGASHDIWIKQLDHGPFTRLTFSGQARRPTWSPDGRTVAFVRDTLAGHDVYAKAADGSGPDHVLAHFDHLVQGAEWSADGQWLLIRTDNTDVGRGDIFGVRLHGDTTPVPLVTSPYEELHPALAPDGRWLAYTSSESGQQEAYVRSFPATSEGRWQVSIGGGSHPRWAPNSRTLYYLSPNPLRMTAADLAPGSQFAVTNRTTLFQLSPALQIDQFHTSFEVTPDGRSFVFIASQSPNGAATTEEHLILVENWFTELHERLKQ